MSADSPAEYLALSSIDGLNAEEAAALGLAIAGEEVRSHGAVRGAASHDSYLAHHSPIPLAVIP
jgi:hypothetical protein